EKPGLGGILFARTNLMLFLIPKTVYPGIYAGSVVRYVMTKDWRRVMAMVAHKTDYVVTFWVPLPFPLGVADKTELNLKHKEMFPENQPGFFVPDHPDGPQYIDQSWVIHQRMNTPIPSGVDFAESLMRNRLEQD